MSDRPLYVQSDQTILLEVASPAYAEARDFLVRCAELEKSPEHFHTYRITPLSLYNAAAMGVGAAEILEGLSSFSKTPVPANVAAEISERIQSYGRLKLRRGSGRDDGEKNEVSDGAAAEEALYLHADDPELLVEVCRRPGIKALLLEEAPSLESGALCVRVDPLARGRLKQELLAVGRPVEDLAGYRDGTPLPIALRQQTAGGLDFGLRDYQSEAAAAFWAGGTVRGGSGVVVLPCGAGKTVVGLAAMSLVGRRTLILSTNLVAVRQWRREILDKTTLEDHQVTEYTGERKELGPVTLSTYQLLTHRRRKTDPFSHIQIFARENWGLIIYDEVHLLPAPIFRMTAEVQAMRRIGLTATLVREDGKENDVFSLIGPKRYDVPWKVLERAGWIAPVECCEVRLALAPSQRSAHAIATPHEQIRIAAENPAKLIKMREIAEHHAARGDLVLVIGQYLTQVEMAARLLDAPLITGKTPNREREELYAAFREGRIRVLVVSRVGNFAIDLPDANVAVQLSGAFGSRQEEAQRLGRILRPKSDGARARFYSLVTRDTREREFAAKRQRFLTEQGYEYLILDGDEFDPAHLTDLTESQRRVWS